MAIVNESSSWYFTKEYHQNQYGDITENSNEGHYASRISSKSDLVVVRPDPYGFRSPSPYTFTAETQTEFQGNVENINFHHPSNNLKDDVKRYHGNLQRLSSSTFRARPIWKPYSISPFPSHFEAKCLNRALLRIKDQEVNYAVTLAEASKSVDLIADTAQSLALAIKNVKRGDIKGAQRALRVYPNGKNRKKARNEKEVSARWLELQYGWAPLLNDLYGVMVDSEHGFLREPRYSATATAEEVSQVNNRRKNGYVYYEDSYGTVTHRCKVRLDYTLRGVDLAALSRLGVLNPAEVAWELVPYSFVVDWFLPIGEYLSTLDAAIGGTFRGGSVTKVTEIRVNSKLTPQYTRTSTSSLSASGDARYESYAMTRSVYSSNPSGSIYLNTNPFNAKKALNSLALMIQKFR